MEPTWESALPPELAHMVRAALEPGEQVLWCARPGRAFYEEARKYAFWIPLLLMAVGVAMVGASIPCTGSQSGLSPIGLLYLAPVLLAGGVACIPAIRALTANQKRLGKATAYVISDRRAMVIGAKAQRGLESFAAELLGGRTKKRKPDGSGTIHIGELSTFPSFPGRATRTLDLVGLDNVDMVDDLLGRAHASADPVKAAAAAAPPVPKVMWDDLFWATGSAFFAFMELQDSTPKMVTEQWAMAILFVVFAFASFIRFGRSVLQRCRRRTPDEDQAPFDWDRP